MEANNKLLIEPESVPEREFIMTEEIAYVEFVFDCIMRKIDKNSALMARADTMFYQRTHSGMSPPDLSNRSAGILYHLRDNSSETLEDIIYRA